MGLNNTQTVGAFDTAAMVEASDRQGDSQRPKPKRKRIVLLLPHEHGAYGQLGFPLITVWLLGRPGWLAAAVTLACVAGFWLHEPAMILAGRRGERRKSAFSRAAWIEAGILGALAAAAGAGAWMAAGRELRWSLGLYPALALLVAEGCRRGLDRKPGFELFSCLGLALCSFPVGLAAGISARRMAAIAAIWGLVQCGSVMAVHGIIARAKRRPGAMAGSAVAVLATPMLLLAAAGMKYPAWQRFAIPLMPALAIAGLLYFRAPSPRHLRRLGWALIGSNVLTLWLLPGVRL